MLPGGLKGTKARAEKADAKGKAGAGGVKKKNTNERAPPPRPGCAAAAAAGVCVAVHAVVTDELTEIVRAVVAGYRVTWSHACSRLRQLAHGVLAAGVRGGWRWTGCWDEDCFNDLFHPLLPSAAALQYASGPRTAQRTLLSRPLSDNAPPRDGERQALFPPFLAPVQAKVKHYLSRRRAYYAKHASLSTAAPVPGTPNTFFHTRTPPHLRRELLESGLLHASYADVEFYVLRNRPVLAAWCLTCCWRRPRTAAGHTMTAQEATMTTTTRPPEAPRMIWRDGSSTTLTRGRTPSLTQPWAADAGHPLVRRASLVGSQRLHAAGISAALAAVGAIVAEAVHPLELMYLLHREAVAPAPTHGGDADVDEGRPSPAEAYHHTIAKDLCRVGRLYAGQECMAAGPFLVDSRMPCGAMGACRWDAAANALRVTAPRDDGGHRMWFCFTILRPCHAPAAPLTFNVIITDLSRQMSLYKPRAGRPHRPVYSANGAPFRQVPLPAKLEDVPTEVERAARKALALARLAKGADKEKKDRSASVSLSATISGGMGDAGAAGGKRLSSLALSREGGGGASLRERPRSAGGARPRPMSPESSASPPSPVSSGGGGGGGGGAEGDDDANDDDDGGKEEVGRAELSFEVSFEGLRAAPRVRRQRRESKEKEPASAANAAPLPSVQCTTDNEFDDGYDRLTVAFTYPYSDVDLMMAVAEWEEQHAAGERAERGAGVAVPAPPISASRAGAGAGAGGPPASASTMLEHTPPPPPPLDSRVQLPPPPAAAGALLRDRTGSTGAAGGVGSPTRSPKRTTAFSPLTTSERRGCANTAFSLSVEGLAGGAVSYDGRDIPLLTVTGAELPAAGMLQGAEVTPAPPAPQPTPQGTSPLPAPPPPRKLSDANVAPRPILPPRANSVSAPPHPPMQPPPSQMSDPQSVDDAVSTIPTTPCEPSPTCLARTPTPPSPLLAPIPGVDASGNREKEYVIVTARVHAGEVPASHMMHGLVQFLVSDDPRAARLRTRYVFKIVPMLNPDGVSRGGSRCDGRGVNLNRVYDNPDPVVHSPVHGVVKLMEALRAEGRKVVAYFDLHAHARQRSIFAYGNETPEKDSIRNLYAFLIGLRCPFFHYHSCNFSDASFLTKSKAGTSRVAIGLKYDIPIALTVEGHYSNGDVVSYANATPRRMLCNPFTPANFHSLGAALAQALLDLQREELADRDTLPDFGNLERIRRYIRQVPIPGTKEAKQKANAPGANNGGNVVISKRRFAA